MVSFFASFFEMLRANFNCRSKARAWLLMTFDVAHMTMTTAPLVGRKSACISVIPESRRYGTCRTCLGKARPRGSKGSMSFASVVDGGWGTNGVKSVIISASFRRRNRSRVCVGHRTILAVPEDGFCVAVDLLDAEVILGRCVLLFEDVWLLRSPITTRLRMLLW